ncbi:MAG: orotidine-5'-phosphate decarboxylase [Candidatus Caenarcaniphilales bacterium]|nr:orotidine-5'-phosphate decarboxylase [Candidatus Caenarcaniphilales bacterium]
MNLDCIALALDFSAEDKVIDLLKSLNPKPSILKIGLELCSVFGIERAVELCKAHSPNSKIFLDLKLHDIPNTVGKTILGIKNNFGTDVNYLTVHTLGGAEMIKASVEAGVGKITIIGVSVLTSHSAENFRNDFGIDLGTLSKKLLKVGVDNGLKWFVSSPQEIISIKASYPSVKLVTPGIRKEGASLQDQKRVATPRRALELGADMLVLGRSITQAENPNSSWIELIQEVEDTKRSLETKKIADC